MSPSRISNQGCSYDRQFAGLDLRLKRAKESDVSGATRHLRVAAESIAFPLGLANDIWPLFRDSPDLDSMQGYGLDLCSYEEVRAGAPEIYARLADC